MNVNDRPNIADLWWMERSVTSGKFTVGFLQTSHLYHGIFLKVFHTSHTAIGALMPGWGS